MATKESKYKKGPLAEDSKVFATKTTKASKEVLDAYGKFISSESSFDAHFVTDKIIEFGKILTGIPVYDYQYYPIYRIIYSVVTVEGATITLLFARQSGKTEAMAFVVDTLAVILPALSKYVKELSQYKNGIKIGLFAPQSDQVVTSYSRAMMRLKSENAEIIMQDPDIDTGLTSYSKLSLTNGSFMLGQTAAKQSKIESKTYDLIIIEEAQDMDDYIIGKSIEPMTTATNGTIVKVGTTGTRKCDFWYEILENRRQSRKIKDERLHLHFENNYKKVIASKRAKFEEDKDAFHLNYEKNVMQKKKRWGEDSDIFKLSYALIWALDSGMFITEKDWDKMLNKRLGLNRAVKVNWTICAGLDIAKRQDSTVLTIGRVYNREDEDDYDQFRTKEVLHWLRINGDDYETQHRAIIEELIDWGVEVLYADATGVGSAVTDHLIAACGDFINIVPYTFSRPSKSVMYQNLQSDIRKGRFIIPSNPAARESTEYKECIEQFNTLEKYYEGSYLVVQAAEGEHDDYPDSAALFCLAGNEEVPEEMEDEGYNPLLDGLSAKTRSVRSSSW